MTSARVDVGDVIRSPSFAYGVYFTKHTEGRKVDGKTFDGRLECYDKVKIGRHTTKVHWALHEERDGWHRETSKLLDVNAHDPTRAEAQFVVTWAQHVLDGPNRATWTVEARRLNGNGSYSPDGELIEFVQGGCSHSLVEDIEVVDKLQQTFQPLPSTKDES